MDATGQLTEINEFLQPNERGTEVNNEIISFESILDLPEGSELETDAKKTFSVIRRLGNANASGESDVFLCSMDGKEYVAKIYRRRLEAKDKYDRLNLISKINAINSERIAKIIDYGSCGNRFFEIFDFYNAGSLADEVSQNNRFSYKELKEKIIPDLAEALNTLHKEGLFHCDLKPGNIMWQDITKNDIVLIDFGISLVMPEGKTDMILQNANGTPLYRAPEVANGVIADCTDYYSLGIIVYELFCGCIPEQIRIKEIPKPEDMPEDLYDLFCGLTYEGYRNRKDRKNPNNRWTYDEVMRWLKGEKLPVPGTVISSQLENDRSIMEFSWKETKFDNIDDLCLALCIFWDDGRKCILRGDLTNHLEWKERLTSNQALWVSQIRDISEEIKYNADQKFIRIIQSLSPERKYLACPLGVFNSLSEFGKRLFECLENDAEIGRNMAISSIELLASVNHISWFMQVMNEDLEEVEHVKSIENGILQGGVMSDCWNRNPDLIIYELAYTLTKDPLDLGLINGKTFSTLDSLKKYLMQNDSSSHKKVYDLCQKYLLDDAFTLKPRVYGWLKCKKCDLSQFNLRNNKRRKK